ncbi:hypothetical protein OF117_05165 [Geodermatophilus sp. YIM 151500]|uniref:Rv0361 family membrane protein n=1 Tax=Geodermatophilus sp. YIM 151500 TaxID=2984531 RepID=UPI0021E40524|nr:hypothetical protein [Geodermatophilus sp. YIM 151500]MCV2488745.1 hypothetical protein [Geodermatophilus sp. YIM 151500]
MGAQDQPPAREPGAPSSPGQWEQRPPPYPPASAAAGSVPPRRRRSRWLTIGLPLAVLAALGGCGVAVWVLVGGVAGSLGPVTRAADVYASALVEQRWQDAHALLCASNRAAVSAADLAAQHGAPPLTGYRIDGVDVSTVNGDTTARVEITFTTEVGLPDRTVLPMTEEGGRWHPCL